MNTNIAEGLQKLSWLELYAPVQGSTKRLAERLIRKSVRNSVMPGDAKSDPLDLPDSTDSGVPEAPNTNITVVPKEQPSAPQLKEKLLYFPERREHMPSEAPIYAPEASQIRVI